MIRSTLAASAVLVLCGVVVDLTAITRSDVGTMTRQVAVFEVVGVVLSYTACLAWAKLRYSNEIGFVIPGLVFTLLVDGSYVSCLACNTVARELRNSTETSSKDNEVDAMQLAGNLLCWVGVISALCVAVRPERSRFGRVALLLAIPIGLCVCGCFVLFSFVDENETAMVAGVTTVVLNTFAALALVGRNGGTLGRGSLAMVGARGYFILQQGFVIDNDTGDTELVWLGISLCWLSVLIAATAVAVTNHISVELDVSHRQGDNLDSLMEAFEELHISKHVLFDLQGDANEGPVLCFRHVSTPILCGTPTVWLVTVSGVCEARRENMLRSKPRSRSVIEAVNDLVVLSVPQHRVVGWETQQLDGSCKIFIELQVLSVTT
eukprot:m.6262 g.6262  ORF g.6262 m.6262 type:complete len:378 (-) comp3814_c0_seq2:221-1354(-)